MAEKILLEKAAPRDYISVIMNFRNLRFMTLIKENCLISDLIHEAERTFAKLSLVKLTIKTLKNSVNAVLPHWYPVAPLIKNRDEIFAFADNAAEALNIDLTKHGGNMTPVQCNSTSPLGSGIMPDSGFASPTIKLATTMESEEPTEMDVDEKGRKVGKNKADENLSQDELLSEVFSLKDHNQNRPRQNNAQSKVYIGLGNKRGENHKKSNIVNEKESSLKVDKDKVETKKLSGKLQEVNVKESMHSPRNELTDKSQNEQELVVGKNTHKVEKAKDKTGESDSDSSSESSDESSRKSSKDKKVKKTSPEGVGKAESESSDGSSESSDDESVHETQEAKSKPEVEDEMSAKNLKEKLDSENKDDTKKLDTKSNINETEKDQSSDSSSSGDDTDEEEAPTKNNHLEKSKVIDITMGNTTMESENIKETSSKKGEASKRGSVSSSLTLSSWSSDDEDQETAKHKDNSQTADVGSNNDTANKNKKPTTPARKGEGETKKNTKKKNGRRKNGVNNDDNDEQINVNAPSSPAKSLCYEKRKEIVLASPAKSVGYKKGVEISFASFAKSVSLEKKSESEDSATTLNAPLTQLPAKDKVNADADEESSDGKNGKHNADKNTGHAGQIESNDPDTTRTPGKKSTRKSAVMRSTSKVASWLLSNPMSANAAEEITDETKSTQKTKKNKTKNNKTSEIDVTDKQIAGKTDLSEETKKNNTSVVNKTVGEKRKVEEENGKEQQSTNTKKQKKKKTEENKKQTDKKIEANQDKPPFKTPVTTKKAKNTSLLLPKTSKGLSALVEDESDYSVKFAKKSKKRKLAPPTITRLKQTGFLTPSNKTQRKALETRTSKSRIKKTPASQPSKTIKMNKKEEEFLDNSVMNLETLLNDETIKW